MKNLIALLFAGSLLISSTLAVGQGQSKNKVKSDDISINRGQINSTLKKVKNHDNSELLDDIDNVRSLKMVVKGGKVI